MPKADLSEIDLKIAHNDVYICSQTGSIVLDSTGMGAIFSCLASAQIKLQTANAVMDMTSDAISGNAALRVAGATPLISLNSASPVGSSGVTLAGETAALSCSLGALGSGLSLGPGLAELGAVADGFLSCLRVTPNGIVIQVGEASITITSQGVLIACGEASYNLTSGGIFEMFGPESSRVLNSSGNTLVGSASNQFVSAETRMVVSPEGVTTTAATVTQQVDATMESEASAVSGEFDADTSLTSAMTTIE
jgi:hypothetical protein